MSVLDLFVQSFIQPGQLVIIFKIILSTLLGFVIGWNRRSSNAGMRTFSLVTLGATIFTIISVIGFPGNTPSADQARISPDCHRSRFFGSWSYLENQI